MKIFRNGGQGQERCGFAAEKSLDQKKQYPEGTGVFPDFGDYFYGKVICTGVERSVFVPSPSWPDSFVPHAHRDPSVLRIRV
jgi:hypothetical protein